MARPTVGELMERQVHTVAANSSLLEAARILRRHRISGLPVLDADSRLVGILSEKDIVAELNRAAGVASHRGILELLLATRRKDHPTLLDTCMQRLLRTPVAEAMTRELVSVQPSDPLDLAAQRMWAAGVKRLPVVESGRLVGIISRQDLVGHEPLTLGLPVDRTRRGRARGGSLPPEGPGPLFEEG
jgi:CBS domain-containing protein